MGVKPAYTNSVNKVLRGIFVAMKDREKMGNRDIARRGTS
jgi:hypothetical protein